MHRLGDLCRRRGAAIAVADPKEHLPRAEQLLDLRRMLDADVPGSQVEAIKRLAVAARIRRLQTDDSIFRQGEPVQLAMCLRGYAAFQRTTVQGQQVMTAIAGPGELYGLTSIAGTIATVDMFALNEMSSPSGTVRSSVCWLPRIRSWGWR
jgi:CRP-like cAMP-binding protein